MKLIEVYSLETKTLKACLARFPEVLGTTVRGGTTTLVTDLSSLGRNHQVTGIRMERLRYQALATGWSVGVRCVDQIHPQLQGAAQQRPCRVRAIGRCDSHGTKADAPHHEVAAESERFSTHGFSSEF
jgi:hypothetical protein